MRRAPVNAAVILCADRQLKRLTGVKLFVKAVVNKPVHLFKLAIVHSVKASGIHRQALALVLGLRKVRVIRRLGLNDQRV
jgi:hypothetical protein